MKLKISSIIIFSILFSFIVCETVIIPSKDHVYNSEKLLTQAKSRMGGDKDLDYFPYLDEFVTYQGWYRKVDKKKSEIENLKDQINLLKEKLFGSKNVDIKKMVDEKKVYDDQFLAKQLKITRILELEDIFNAEKKGGL